MKSAQGENNVAVEPSPFKLRGSLYNAGAPGALLWPFPVNLAGNWGPSPTDTPSFPNAVIGYNEELGKLRNQHDS
jgi:hypothetical protein